MKTVGHNRGDFTPQGAFGHVWEYIASYMDYRINIPYEGGTAESLLPGSRLGTKSTH